MLDGVSLDQLRTFIAAVDSGSFSAGQTKSPPGPAGRWFIERLKQTPVAASKVPKAPAVRSKRRRAARA